MRGNSLFLVKHEKLVTFINDVIKKRVTPVCNARVNRIRYKGQPVKQMAFFLGGGGTFLLFWGILLTLFFLHFFFLSHIFLTCSRKDVKKQSHNSTYLCLSPLMNGSLSETLNNTLFKLLAFGRRPLIFKLGSGQ